MHVVVKNRKNIFQRSITILQFKITSMFMDNLSFQLRYAPQNIAKKTILIKQYLITVQRTLNLFKLFCSKITLVHFTETVLGKD